MTRDEILKATKTHKQSKKHPTNIVDTSILYTRGNKVWWLHYWGYGNCAIELSEYGVN